MTFKEANKKLKQISKGEYRTVRFEQTTFSGGRTKTECRVYFHPGMYGEAPTWTEAFKELDKAMNPGCYIEEIPNISDGDEVQNDTN